MAWVIYKLIIHPHQIKKKIFSIERVKGGRKSGNMIFFSE